jgi:protocatechuate 3,4-dioxygenase alpha subunit
MNTALSEVGPPAALAVPRQRTPSLILGPFYPLRPPAYASGDLWAQRAGCARQAQPVAISGRVVNLAGCAVVNALVEVWQADESGRYHHPSAPHLMIRAVWAMARCEPTPQAATDSAR